MGTRSFVVASVLMMLAMPSLMAAQGDCPPEVTTAGEMLKKTSAKMQPSRPLAGARGQEVQAPRGQDVQAPRGQDVQAPRGQDVQAPRGQDVQAPRGQDVQAPRGQDVQAPRGQDVQAPRGQDVQAPRGQDVQAPRGQDVQAPRIERGRSLALSNAGDLVREAETACREGDNSRASANAKAAIELLTYLQ
jgi:hypothetical protein